MYETAKKEKALLVIVDTGNENWPMSALADEFRSLVISCGIDAEETVIFKKKEITPSLYIGKGKVEELSSIVQEKDTDVVIFNNNLTFTQQRNLEDIFCKKTIDRTQLILDIFARHAHTQEGIIQVELAQLEYLLPRLKGKGIMLSRLGGGIGTRGPGEKKLEADRRKITARITRLKKDLAQVRKHREVMRKKRQKERLNVCSLVGYTNAGKSTLFNALTESSERAAPSLFTTLDTVSRTVRIHNGLKVLFTDTVGFIYKLPPHLIESFRATLEELSYADLLLHVIDASSPGIKRLIASVEGVLKDLKLDRKQTILVFNKTDKLSPEEAGFLKREYPDGVFISALKRKGLGALREGIYEAFFKDTVEAVLKFPFSLMEVADYIHRNCEIIKKNYQENDVVYWVRSEKGRLVYLKKMGVAIKEL